MSGWLPLPSQTRLLELLDYDPITGGFLWRSRPENFPWSCKFAGKPAGHVARGYRSITIDGHCFNASRLAWKIIHGADPADLIDHKNNNSTDDRIGNLREATRITNGQNSKRRVGQSRPKGVWANGPGFCAMICVEKRRLYLGQFPTMAAAGAAYADAARQHFGEFARTS